MNLMHILENLSIKEKEWKHNISTWIITKFLSAQFISNRKSLLTIK